jgi:hypothetical protein
MRWPSGQIRLYVAEIHQILGPVSRQKCPMPFGQYYLTRGRAAWVGNENLRYVSNIAGIFPPLAILAI